MLSITLERHWRGSRRADISRGTAGLAGGISGRGEDRAALLTQDALIALNRRVEDRATVEAPHHVSLDKEF
jgi:hypothetical protein